MIATADRPIDVAGGRTDAELARRSLLRFTRRMYPAYSPAWFHREIASLLEGVLAGAIRRAAIIVPPRHGKSTLASEHFPAFALGRDPDSRMIACSHTQPLADRFSRMARGKLRDPRYPFPIALSAINASVRDWAIEDHRGGYYATGVNGTPTGIGANILLIDDPVRSYADADSPIKRESTWEWLQGTIYPRLEGDGRIVLIGTRWHHDDMIGRAIRRGADRWTVLHLPAILPNGSALWPEKFPLNPVDTDDPTAERRSLAEIREDVGERNFQAQYLGEPTPDTGSIFKWDWFLPLYDDLPDGITYFVQHWDTAFVSSASADFSVCTTWAVSPFGMWLVDIWRQQVAFPDLKRAAVSLYRHWKVRETCIEAKGSGISLIQELRATESKLNVIEIEPIGDKERRAHDVTPVLESKRIHIPRWASWLDDFRAEVLAFPLGGNDDQVDSLTQAIAREMGVGASTSTARSSSYLETDAEDPRMVWDDERGAYVPRRRSRSLYVQG